MHPLDNVIWNALTSRHAQFAERHDQACRFSKDVSVLGALLEPTRRGFESLERLVAEGERVGLFLDDAYQDRPGWSVVLGGPLLQMVAENGIQLSRPSSGTDIVELGDSDSDGMQELTALTKPGPFGPRTHKLGNFIGIRIGSRLVAMAGERLKVPGYTEVSAVCTHPDHAGKGYARMLTTEVMKRIRERNETPFLHVRADNESAIGLYRKLGFQERKGGNYVVIRRS